MTLDEDIKTDVIKQLKWDNRIDASKISVMVDTGKVKLEGEVPTYKTKRIATDDAYSVTGVINVENDLDVKYVTIPTDEELKENVKTTLLFNTDIPSTEIDVEVVNSWVTLKGTVDAYWKKMQAEWDTLDVNGVVGVTNEIAVVPSESIADELIAEDIIEALERNTKVYVDNVTIKVDEGKVTLTGTVPDYTAKQAAETVAFNTLGVIDVENNIRIELA